MTSIKRAVLYGLAIWAFPFIVAMAIFPLRTADRAFFESIMPVSLVLIVMLSTACYFKKVSAHYLKEGVWLGMIFFGISLVIDLLLFSWGPMAMPTVAYFKDIGFTYLLIPMITIGVGYLLEKKQVAG